MKSVLITGTNKGIGFETALSFARKGYKVFATMRNLGAAASLIICSLKKVQDTLHIQMAKLQEREHFC